MKYKIKVPTRIEERIHTSRILCDGCGKETNHNEADQNYDDVKIETKIGQIYPEDDFREIYEVDLCGDCFIDKIIPALKEVGINVRCRDLCGYGDGRVWEPPENK